MTKAAYTVVAPGWSLGHWNCPTREKHTPAPSGYTAWHEWAEKKAKTHKQERCPGCTRFAIWVPVAAAGRET